MLLIRTLVTSGGVAVDFAINAFSIAIDFWLL